MLAEALLRLRTSWRRVLAAEIVFKAVGMLLTAAGSAAMLRLVELKNHRAAVTNADLVGFLTTPASLVLLGIAIAVAASLILVEHATLLALLGPGVAPGASFAVKLRAASAAVARTMRLALLCVGVILAIVLPAVGLIGGTYVALLSGHDINYYLAEKPPVFLAAVAIAGVIAAVAAAILAVLLVRWILAVPIAVYEGAAPRPAIAESKARVRGNARAIALTLLAWHGTIALVSLACFAGFRPFAARMVENAGESTGRAVTTIVLLLTLHGLGVAAGSLISAVGHASIVLHWYRRTHPGGAESVAVVREEAGQPWIRGPLALGSAGVLVLSGFIAPALLLVARRGTQEKIDITAHRGASHAAPENTMAAFSAAIDAGAEWAELDVQETVDGKIVVLHDQDLMRLADKPWRLAEMTFEEARQVDIGSKFDPRFAGERIPTLQEVIDLARGKIKLNIELKYYGEDPRLAPDVARLLRENDFADHCVVASLHFGALEEARKAWPDLRTAAIVTVRAGDPTQLPVDQLSMGARLVTSSLLRSAHRQGKEVLVWTIDDTHAATRLMELGVDNIITNEPAALVKVRNERNALSRAERLVLAFRVALGVDLDKAAAAVPAKDL